MGTIVQPSSGDVPEIPDGLYRATITGVKSVSLDAPDKFGKTEKIDLTVEFEVDGEVFTLDPRVNRAWSEKATLFTIAVACGIDANPLDSFDADDLLNRQVNILTEQEEGKWPRVKSWSRIKAGKAPAASQKPTAPSAPTASVVNPDGTANYDAFWAGVRRLGLDRSHVLAHTGGDIDAFMALDGPDVAFILEELTAKVGEGAPA